MNLLLLALSNRFKIDIKYFVSGGFWLLIAQISTITASLLTATFFAHYLTENDYGAYRYIIGISAILTAFSLTGLPHSILQATARGYKKFIQESLPLTLKYSLGITFSSLILAGYYYLNDNNTLALGCILISILHPLTALFSNSASYLTGQSKFKAVSNLQTTKSIFVSGSSLITLLITQNILTLLAVYFVSQAVISIAAYCLLKPGSDTDQKTPNEVWTSHIRYAKHTSIRSAMSRIANGLDSIIVFQHLGASQLAVFSIASLIPDQIRGSLKNLQTLLLPKYSKHESTKTLRHSIPLRSLQFFVLLIALSVISIFLIPILYSVLFPKYTEVILYAQLLTLSFPASIFHIPYGALMAQKADKSLYRFDISVSAVQIISLLILVYSYGIIGAVISKIITQYTKAIVSYYLLYKN